MSKPTNATPKPLSCQLHGLFLGTLCPACSAGHPAEANLKAQPAPKDANSERPDLVYAINDLTDRYESALGEIESLKAQPAPVPLAEDEALIARFKEIVTFCNTMGPRGSISVNDLGTLGNILERLSLRSGQLAQVLALCDDAESTKQAKECVAGGGVICIQVPEIRAAIEGAE